VVLIPGAIDDWPATWIEKLGTTFARFGADTQDSGNISYAGDVDGTRSLRTC
jgi:hypothetical protein